MDMKRAYYEDIELFKSGTILFWTIVLMVGLFTLPLFSSKYYLYLFNLMLVHVIVAVGLWWLLSAKNHFTGPIRQVRTDDTGRVIDEGEIAGEGPGACSGTRCTTCVGRGRLG